jgi:hypothetical protein
LTAPARDDVSESRVGTKKPVQAIDRRDVAITELSDAELILIATGGRTEVTDAELLVIASGGRIEDEMKVIPPMPSKD